MRIDSKRMIKARERLGLSQTKLANSLGIPASTVSRIEKGALSGAKLAVALAGSLKVDVGWLLGGSDDLAPTWAGRERVADRGGEYRADSNVSQMLAEILTKVGEQNAEIKYLRGELRDTQTRLSRLESGLSGSRVREQRGA
jgi:DNA-binding XRE family transcriptional regulator